MIWCKKYLFILLLAGILLNCSEDDDTIDEKQVTGHWIWIKSTGGIDGRTETTASTGNTIKLEITKKSVKRYVNGDLVSDLGYTLQTMESGLFGKPMDMIRYENGSDQVIERNQEQLIFTDDCFDCFQHVYIKE